MASLSLKYASRIKASLEAELKTFKVTYPIRGPVRAALSLVSSGTEVCVHHSGWGLGINWTKRRSDGVRGGSRRHERGELCSSAIVTVGLGRRAVPHMRGRGS